MHTLAPVRAQPQVPGCLDTPAAAAAAAGAGSSSDQGVLRGGPGAPVWRSVSDAKVQAEGAQAEDAPYQQVRGGAGSGLGAASRARTCTRTDTCTCAYT